MSTMTKPRALEEFTEVTNTLANPAIRKWKERGGHVVGYLCSAVPAEIITAAGLLPFRMRATGSTSTELADAYFININCSFPRHCFNQALRGEFDFLSGLVCVNSCDHVRRIYDNWKRQVKTTHMVEVLSLPKKIGEPQIEWYRQELANLRDALQKQFNVQITDKRLWDAIRIHNRTRRLQRELYELRKRDNPPITGADALAVTVAGTAMPPEQYNEMLADLLEELKNSEGITDYRARLMVVGGILDNPDYVAAIEEQGGLVVTDSLCYGARACWADVDETDSDPLRALAKYCVADRPSCPRMMGDQPRRSEFVRNMVRDFKVDGIIGERLAFCDMWLVELFMLTSDLKEDSVPFLKLEREYTMSGTGQIATRVQAFIEAMGR